MPKTAITTLAALFVVAFVCSSRADEPVSFRKQVAPVLLANCLACHGPKKAEGGYRIDTFERLTGLGDSGANGFVAKDVDSSEAFRRVTSDDKAERMPLEGDPLPAEQVALLKRWIDEGAKYDADDPKADLATIVPPPEHPPAPESYPNTMPVTALAFSADGSELFVGGYHELTVWNPADGVLVRRVANIGERTYGLALSPDGATLAVACGAPGRLGEVRLLDPASGELKGVLATSSDVVFDCAFSPDGSRLATCAADGVIRIFEMPAAEEIKTITSHSDWVMSVAWSADGKRLASASRDKTAKVFDVETGDLVVTYSGHNQPVKGIAFHPEGKELYSAAADNKVHRWQIEEAKKTADAASFGGEVYKLVVGGDFLFASSADKSARQLELKTHKEVRKFPGHADWVLSAAYHAGAKRLATGGFDGEVRLWNTEDGKQTTSFVAAPGYSLAAKKSAP
jgi:dipeptidyl aminopeptidase/acylaminoacyl peptidase